MHQLELLDTFLRMFTHTTDIQVNTGRCQSALCIAHTSHIVFIIMIIIMILISHMTYVACNGMLSLMPFMSYYTCCIYCQAADLDSDLAISIACQSLFASYHCVYVQYYVVILSVALDTVT